jgi:2-polyprenyl-6-hydroxyphenyl methylase/3-demethylubiquinone-9 3-methyltransferase
MVTSFFLPSLALLGLIGDVTHRRNPLQRYREPRARGMSTVRDWYDWLGGYPFEVARPEVIFRFLRDRGFVLREFKTVAGGWGCNEFVFRRETGEGSF